MSTCLLLSSAQLDRFPTYGRVRNRSFALTSPSMSVWHYAAGTQGLLVGLFNLRPTLVGFQNLPHGHLQSVYHIQPHDHFQSVPQFNKESLPLFNSFISINLLSSPQLQKFKNHLDSTWRPPPGRLESSESAAAQLEHLTNITLAATPERTKSK